MMASLSNCVLAWWKPVKAEQVLDPISTLGMLALRTLACYKNAKPAASDNWFYFDEEETGQGVKRLKEGVGNDDLYFLESNFKFFVKAWKPLRNPELDEIVKIAIEGLKIMRKEYKALHKNAANTCKINKELLKGWLPKEQANQQGNQQQNPVPDQLVVQARAYVEEKRKSKQKGQDPAALDMIEQLAQRVEQLQLAPRLVPPGDQVIPVVELTHLEIDRQSKIYALWPQEEITTFVSMLRQKDDKAKALIEFLESKKIAYIKLLNPNSK